MRLLLKTERNEIRTFVKTLPGSLSTQGQKRNLNAENTRQTGGNHDTNKSRHS